MKGLVKFAYDAGCVFIAFTLALGMSMSALWIIYWVVEHSVR
jgi:hypothetical protein